MKMLIKGLPGDIAGRPFMLKFNESNQFDGDTDSTEHLRLRIDTDWFLGFFYF